MNIKRLFIALKKSVKNNKELIKLAKPYFLFLENGNYYIDYVSRIIYKTSEQRKYKNEAIHTYDGFYAYGNKKNKIMLFFSTILHRKRFTIRQKQNKYHYTLGIIGSQRDSIKLFDYQNNVVASFYFNSLKKEKIIENRSKISGVGYQAPRLFESDRLAMQFNAMVEQLIIKKDYDYNEGIISWFKRMISFDDKDFNCFADKSISQKQYFVIRNFLTKYNFKKELMIFEENIKMGHYKVTLCHGDFYPLNFIYDGSKYYVIDYECVCVRHTMFDFFTFIFKSYYIFKDERLINKYFNGEYDPFLESLFKKNGSVYHKNAKTLYFLINLIELYDYRLNDGFQFVFKLLVEKFKAFFSCV